MRRENSISENVLLYESQKNVKWLILFSNVPAEVYAKLVAFSISVIMTFCVLIIGY